MFDGPVPRIFNIAPGQPFAQRLAEGVLARLEDRGPLSLARTTIYAPTRRGARTLTQAFVSLAAGVPILAPRILTLADLDDPLGLAADLPPAIDPTDRLLTLTRLVRGMADRAPHLAQEATAPALARDLMVLLDQIQGERLSLDDLERVAAENHAEHWSDTLVFLNILRDAWPKYLASVGKMDPVARRGELIARQIAAWQAAPPSAPVIVAGSTGSVGISAELIAAVAHLPQGAVVLPGLDRDLEAATFRELGAAYPDHPQAGLARLLSRIGGENGPVPRASVAEWTGDAEETRQTFLSIALRPAPVTDAWLAKRETVSAIAPKILADVDLIETETPQEEAQAIALAIREAVEDPERTVALITTDRTLARRVSAALLRWKIVADDSAGRPLRLTPPGVFLALLIEQGLRAPGVGDPARLLALLKHPLTSLGLSRSDHLAFVRRVEIEVIRHGSAGDDLETMRRVFEDDERLSNWIDVLDDALSPLRALAGQHLPLSQIVGALKIVAESLSLRPDGGVEVWNEAAGQAALTFIDDIIEHASSFGALEASAVPALLIGLMQDRSVRAPYGQHPRVFIWGTLEARMLSADVTILGALNEDSWPRVPDPDPWMSRSMRRDFGLPPLERRVGLSSHDFQQAMGASRVILTRARKQDGAPTVASRWLQRIVTLLGEDDKGFARNVLKDMRARGDRYRAWAVHRMRERDGQPAARPEPKPPVEARPPAFSVTDIETLIRDPYAIYARRVLGLLPLDPLAPEPDARIRGEVMHRIVEGVAEAWPPDGESPEALYRRITETVLQELEGWPVVRAFYRARAERIMARYLAHLTSGLEQNERPVLLEGSGQVTVPVAGFGNVALSGRADRIDSTPAGYAIYDYKTGKPPTQNQVKVFARQLPLEGAMVQAGTFEGLPAGEVAKLAYIHLSGGKEGLREYPLTEDVEQQIAEALPRLSQLLTAYADEDQGYLSRARAEFLRYESDYDHLARVGEWTSGEGEE